MRDMMGKERTSAEITVTGIKLVAQFSAREDRDVMAGKAISAMNNLIRVLGGCVSLTRDTEITFSDED